MKHFAWFMLVVPVALLAGCRSNNEPKTPEAVEQDAERAGEKVEEGVEEVGEAIEEAGDEVEEETENRE